MNAPLAGRRIVVTRPEAQAGSLCAAVEALGATALRAPLFAIEPCDDPATLQAIEVLAARLDEFSLAFFVSANAVEYGVRALRAHRSWPPHLRVATVGPASEAALRKAGFDAVIAPQTQFDSEAVLALPEFSAAALAGRQVLILRGDGGRELMAETLHERRAIVSVQSCYCRRALAPDLVELLAARPDALVITSSEALRNLARQLGGFRDAAVLRQLPVFAPHERIVRQAEELGFATAILTAGADAGLVAGMLSYFAAR